MLRELVRTAAGRQPQPTAALIDSRSVRAADTVPTATRGWDNAKKGKKGNGRTRHIAVDVTGLVLAVVITAASVQDRDAARPLRWNLHSACRRVRLIWADAGYTGKLTARATTTRMTVQIVAKRDLHAFEVLPCRWVAERTFASISKRRRTTRDYEGENGFRCSHDRPQREEREEDEPCWRQAWRRAGWTDGQPHDSIDPRWPGPDTSGGRSSVDLGNPTHPAAMTANLIATAPPRVTVSTPLPCSI